MVAVGRNAGRPHCIRQSAPKIKINQSGVVKNPQLVLRADLVRRVEYVALYGFHESVEPRICLSHSSVEDCIHECSDGDAARCARFRNTTQLQLEGGAALGRRSFDHSLQ